jgi:hypothetical protein
MTVSGFTFVRDAIRLQYPVVASLQSVLPVVDELVVNVGESSDGTLELVQRLDSPKVKIFQSAWDERLVKGGRILAQQTDLALERCAGDVCLYLQADEVIHEADLPALRAALSRLHSDPRVEGLLFDYVHLYGNYHSVATGRRWYRHEVRAFRNGLGVRSWRDAQGFRVFAPGGDSHRVRKLRVIRAGVRVFHYGWVRPPTLQARKCREFGRWYHGAEAPPLEERTFQYDQTERVVRLRGTHPAGMRELVAADTSSFEPRLRGVRLRQLRVDLLDLFEAVTSIRVGEYRNYKLVP